jgi:hypothetical protein
MHPRRSLFAFALSFALLLAFTAIAPRAAHAVNLVPNDSFESFTSCPVGFSNMSDCVSWYAPTTGTSDYYNACVTGPNTPSVPTNNFGFQNARTGVAYAGFIPYSSAADYREYVETALASPLSASVTYTVKFYVSLADISNRSLDRIGAYLSVGPVGPVGNYAPLPYTPQIESPANVFLNDTVNWMLISGTYTAAGGEDHIVIGNFHDDASTSFQVGPGNWAGGCNYFVDDVSVEVVAQVDQACCLPDGTCSLITQGECQAAGGTPLGVGTNCSPDPCGATGTRRTTWGGVKIIYR